MRLERHDGAVERRLCIAMIVDKTALGRIASKWRHDMLRAKWSNQVAQWCVDYYRRHQDAPGKRILHIFENWAETAQDKDTIDLTEKFLVSLSNEWEELEREANPGFTIDQAATYLNHVAAERLAEAISGDLAQGKVSDAITRINSFGKVDIGVGSGIDPLQDEEAILAAFAEKSESVLDYPDDLGRFFGGNLYRGGFVAVMAPEKFGKSFVLMDMAYRAVAQRRRVAYFEAGDMSQNQWMRRFMIRVAQLPRKAGPTRIPIDISKTKEDEFAVVEHKTEELEKINWRTADLACKAFMRDTVRSKKKWINLSCHPTKTLSVAGIYAELEQWERDEGFTPDLVICDYADLLVGKQRAKADPLNEIEEIWADLRGLSLKQHCLVVTATQANAASYKAKSLDRTHFSGNKKKFAYVTGMLTLNQTKAERDMQVMRMGWLLLREDDFPVGKHVNLAQCLALAQPAMLSCL